MAGRNHQVIVRLSMEELEKIRTKADKLGLNISSFMRVVSLLANLDTDNIRKK